MKIFFGDRLKNFCEDLFFFFFWRALALVSLVLGLEHSCPWPRIFFVSLALASSLVSSTPPLLVTEVESSRTHFQVLGLGLEASSPRKLPCPWLEDSTFFSKSLKFSKSPEKTILEGVFYWRTPEKNFQRPFFLRTLALEPLVLEHSCPWPREGLSLASDFFFVCPWPRALCPRLHL